MFYWVTKNSKFPATNGDLTKPIPTVLLLCLRAMYFDNLLKIVEKLIATCKKRLLYMRCPLTRERKQKKNPIFTFISVRVRL